MHKGLPELSSITQETRETLPPELQPRRILVWYEGVPKGSKISLGRRKIVDINRTRLSQYTSMIIEVYRKKYGEFPQLKPPIKMSVIFAYQVPKSRRKFLKGKQWIWKVTVPDLDKCFRAVADALSGLAYEDDKVIASRFASKIFYPGKSYTDITIEHIPDPE